MKHLCSQIPAFRLFLSFIGLNLISVIVFVTTQDESFIIPPVVCSPFIASAAIGAAFGHNKGRTGAGFWLGFFFGPIGWLVILVGPSRVDRRTVSQKLTDMHNAVEAGALTSSDLERYRRELLGLNRS